MRISLNNSSSSSSSSSRRSNSLSTNSHTAPFLIASTKFVSSLKKKSSLLLSGDSSPIRKLRRNSPRTLPLKLSRERREGSEPALEWMLDSAPRDIVPRILVYLGPRRIRVLSGVNKQWRDVCYSEPVWRTLSEDLGKWDSSHPMPSSWLSFYRKTPCVPIDYNSINSAFGVLGEHASDSDSEERRIRILLFPGTYTLDGSLVVARDDAHVTVETLDIKLSPPTHARPEDEWGGTVASERGGGKKKSISCLSSSSVITACPSSASSGSFQPATNYFDAASFSYHDDLDDHDDAVFSRRAILKLDARKPNQPIFRVSGGTLNIQNLALRHNSNGTDIWNGNAGVQIQPPVMDSNASTDSKPRAIISKCSISSLSGRGIVNIDGGFLEIHESLIHNCAATGVYIGGPGSSALIQTSDVIANGNGNETNRRGGIARGHSGIYLEQGEATIQDCCISKNSLTGISAVSPENAFLQVMDCDLMGNGIEQLELPPNGSLSRGKSVCRDNSMRRDGMGRIRSGLFKEEAEQEIQEDERTDRPGGREM